MTVYLDTSLLVSALTGEASTPRVNDWLRKQAGGTLFISDWTHTEVASALSIKMRTGELTLVRRADALFRFAELAGSSLPTLAVVGTHFELAAGYAGRHELALRAGDALHLAIAQSGGHSVATLDIRMMNAALQLGIPIEAI